jgi:Tol biopolymer transport system component
LSSRLTLVVSVLSAARYRPAHAIRRTGNHHGKEQQVRTRLLAAVATAVGAITLLAAAGAGADPHGQGPPSRLAFAIKDATNVSNIYSVDPDGDGLVRLTNTPALDLCPDYSSDGRLITFCSNRSGSFQIWAMNADGSNVHMVTNGNGRLIFPDYSPDASKIVFSGTASAVDVNQNVYVTNADGTGLQQLTTDGNNQFPTFSPDGKRIAFISDRTGVEQVWLMNADGTNQTQLSKSGVREDQVPDWSPDGRKVAFAQGAVGSGRIWVINADGSNPVQLTSGPGDDFGTAWSPDGRQIAFVRDFANNDRSVWTMNADGSDQQRLMPIPLTEYVPTWVRSAGNGNGND